jgi:hypothetical protein
VTLLVWDPASEHFKEAGDQTLRTRARPIPYPPATGLAPPGICESQGNGHRST